MIANTGGDPDIEMTNCRDHANPIYIPDSQESVFPLCPTPVQPLEGRQPIPGLEWKTVSHKQINTLPTISGSYVTWEKQMMPTPLPKNNAPIAPTTPAFTSKQLHT